MATNNNFLPIVKNKLRSGIAGVIGFVGVTSILFRFSRGELSFIPFLHPILKILNYQSAWLLPSFMIIDWLFCIWVVRENLSIHNPWKPREWFSVSCISLLFLLTFVSVGNYFKFGSFFHDDWMWCGVFWLHGITLTLSLSTYITWFYPVLWERLGHRFARWDKFMNAPQPNAGDRIFLLLISLWTLGLTLGMGDFVLGGIPHVQDSIAQLFQAKVFALGRLWLPTPVEPKFFEKLYVIPDAGRWYSIYPPGHALILALGVLAGAPQWINPISSVLIIWLFFGLTQKALSAPLARWGALLLGGSPFFLFMGSEYMNHTTSLLFLLLYLRFLWSLSLSKNYLSRIGFGLFAGGCWGMAFLIRPVTALAFLAIGAVWFWMNDSFHIRKMLSAAVGFSVGFLPALCFYFLFNTETTGKPWLTGFVKYFDANPMGFGWKPWGKNPMGPLIPAGVFHTPFMGLINTIMNLNGLNYYLFGWPVPSLLFVYLLWFPGMRRNRWDWFCLFSCGMVLLVYFFYFYQDYCFGPRFVFEALPFIVLLCARGIQETIAGLVRFRFFSSVQARGMIYSWLLVFFVIGVWFTWMDEIEKMSHGYWYTSESAVRLVKRELKEKNALIITEDGDDYSAVFSLMEPTLDHGWIFALDYGYEENQKLIRLYPNWPVYRLRLEETDKPGRFKSVLEPYTIPSSGESHSSLPH